MKLETFDELLKTNGARLVLLLRAPYDYPAGVPCGAERGDRRLREVLDELEAEDLIEHDPQEGTKRYRCTPKGEEVRKAFCAAVGLPVKR